MKKLIMLSSLSLLLVACGDNSSTDGTAPVEENTPDEGTEDTTTDDNTTEDNSTADEATDDTTETGEMITVEIEFDIDDDLYDVDEDSWEQRVEVAEGTTLLDFMQEHYTIEETDGVVTSIEGYAEDPERNYFWTLEINDRRFDDDISTYVLENNDEIEWELDD